MPAAPLRLDQRRDFVDLLTATVGLFARHPLTFLGVTLLVVAPVWVALDRLGDTSLRWGAIPVWAVVVPPVVTAMHVRIVQRLGEGVAPTPWRAVREAAGRMPVAVLAGTLYAVGVTAGLLLLVVPGIWLAVRWYFAPQAAVLDGGGPPAALRSSGALVRGHWARSLVYLTGSGIVLGVLGALPIDLVGTLVGEEGGMVLDVLIQSVVASLTALFGTLLYFDLRVRKASEV